MAFSSGSPALNRNEMLAPPCLLVELMLSTPSRPFSCCSNTRVTLCSTTSGEAAGKAGVNADAGGREWRKILQPQAEQRCAARQNDQQAADDRKDRPSEKRLGDRPHLDVSKVCGSWQEKSPDCLLGKQPGDEWFG